MMILGSKRLGGGGFGYFLGQVHWRYFGFGLNPGEAFADVCTIFSTLCTFYFLAFSPGGLWTTDELDESGRGWWEPVGSLQEELSDLLGALSDLT